MGSGCRRPLYSTIVWTISRHTCIHELCVVLNAVQGDSSESLNTVTVLVIDNKFIGNVIGKKGANVHEVLTTLYYSGAGCLRF